jgi:hypothetical protein
MAVVGYKFVTVFASEAVKQRASHFRARRAETFFLSGLLAYWQTKINGSVAQ